MTDKARTVGFRLGESHRAELESRARKSGSTPGELARQFVVETLEGDQEVERLRMKVSAVESELGNLRKDLSVSVQALLVATGRVTAEQAREWVKQNLEKGGG